MYSDSRHATRDAASTARHPAADVRMEPSLAAVPRKASRRARVDATMHRPDHHIIVNGERLVLSHIPTVGEAPPLDEVGAGEQCDGCGGNAIEVLRYTPVLRAFVCTECDSTFAVRVGGYLDV